MKQASANFPCCMPEHNVRQAAEMMAGHECGEIAAVETEENLKPIGVITDRDITWRVVATGKSPGANERARCRIKPPVTVATGLSMVNQHYVK